MAVTYERRQILSRLRLENQSRNLRSNLEHLPIRQALLHYGEPHLRFLSRLFEEVSRMRFAFEHLPKPLNPATLSA